MKKYSNWYLYCNKGVLDEKIGFFPCIFVQEIQDKRHTTEDLIDLQISSPLPSSSSSDKNKIGGLFSPEQTVP